MPLKVEGMSCASERKEILRVVREKWMFVNSIIINSIINLLIL